MQGLVSYRNLKHSLQRLRNSRQQRAIDGNVLDADQLSSRKLSDQTPRSSIFPVAFRPEAARSLRSLLRDLVTSRARPTHQEHPQERLAGATCLRATTASCVVQRRFATGTRVCYWRADVPSVGFLATIRQGPTALLSKHKGAWLGPATVLAQEKGRSQEQHEEAHGTVWIVVHGRLMRCAPEHLRHLSERESLSLDRDKGVEERPRTFTDIVQDFTFSKGTHVDL